MKSNWECVDLVHEIKSPLASIKSAIEVLNAEKQLSPSSAHTTQYLHMIERNTSRLDRFLEEFLEAIHFKEKRQGLNYRLVHFNELVRDALESYQLIACKKNITLKCLASSPQIWIRCDRNKVEHVILNLISNAIKYSTHGLITFYINEKADEIEVSIEDNGMGMTQEELNKVFNRYFRSESAQKIMGTGVGLSIAKLWVEAHGGEIRATSNGTNQGSQFSFTLPK